MFQPHNPLLLMGYTMKRSKTSRIIEVIFNGMSVFALIGMFVMVLAIIGLLANVLWPFLF